MEYIQGNPGRTAGGKGSTLLFEARQVVAKFFGIQDISRIIFTPNATAAMNIGIQGILRPGDRVVTSSMEHNSVSRPLNALKKYQDITYQIVQTSTEGLLDGDDLKKALQILTKLVVINHAFNVKGSYHDLEPLAYIAKEHGAYVMIDSSLCAGVVDIDVIRDHIDILACPGHTSLLGPTGTGFCYIAPNLEARPILYGGTGR